MSRSLFGALPTRTRRRVVVTGAGAVTPVGTDAATMFMNVSSGVSGVRPLREVPFFIPAQLGGSTPEEIQKKTETLYSSLPCQVAAPVLHHSSPEGQEKTKDPYAPTSREPRSFRFARLAADEAIAHAGLAGAYPPERIGVSIGMGMPGLQDVGDASMLLYAHPTAVSYSRISPFFVPKILGNLAAGCVAMAHSLRGPINSCVTACATGAHSIGEALRWVERGDAEAAVCGATEACLTPVGIAGFCRMHAMSTKYNDTPHKASRPFDAARCGFVMGEGAGVIVLEEREAALARGATILAELRGYATSSDAYHIASPHPEGAGAAQCVAQALLDAGVAPEQVGYVNAHATGTPLGDEIELAALARVLRAPGTKAPPLLVSSSKGVLGHLLGAAGSVEAIIALMAVQHGRVPPNVNLEEPIAHDTASVVLPTCVTEMPELVAALSTSFGFGGANAALVFTKHD